MKKKLFFKATRTFKNGSHYSDFFKLILLFLFWLPTFFSATALGVKPLATDQVTIISDSSDVRINGAVSIFNARITKVENSATPTKVEKTKVEPKAKSIADQVIVKELNENLALRKLQEKIDKNVSTFYSTSRDRELQRLAKLRFANCATVSTLNYNFSSALFLICFYISKVETKLSKQNFYSTFSHLSSGKLRYSFLRGPPQQSYFFI